MVVVPTAHQVTLHYGASPADIVGQTLTALGAISLLAVAVRKRMPSRRKRGGTTDLSPAP
jgi:hypothetical protein